ncbi:MAG: signal transduction histidine kinase [Myxococcota bacterium]|jgi:signal transduction histidine kinase
MPTRSQQQQRQQFIQSGQLHWFHWLLLLLSLALTMTTWSVTRAAHAEKVTIRFDEETSRVTDLLIERMQRYDDALLAGAAFAETVGGALDFVLWERFADALLIQGRYPGINGIGVIHLVERDDEAAYLARQRTLRPDYAIHPSHDRPELLPISYIIPAAENKAAIGLDIAHEANRYEAARQALATGEPQITGPIVLVQDTEQTPGFLFYAPYEADLADSDIPRVGMVYAPFVVRELIDGTLSQENRLVHIRLLDREEVLYDELASGEDRGRMQTRVLSMYGRDWTLEIEATEAFRGATENNQSSFILAFGLGIDALLLWFFVVFSKANQRAIAYADQVTVDLKASQVTLARANSELLHFNYRSSHDLSAPLRTIQGYLSLLRDDLSEGEVDDAMSWLERIEAQCERLINLISDLMDLARAHNEELPVEEIALHEEVSGILEGLGERLREREITATLDCALDPPLRAPRRRVLQMVENLLSNAIRYASPDREQCWVAVTARRVDGAVTISVQDNGIGVPEPIQERIFEMFFRGAKESAAGSGLGLYLVRQYADSIGATVSLKSSNEGSTFSITIPGG